MFGLPDESLVLVVCSVHADCEGEGGWLAEGLGISDLSATGSLRSIERRLRFPST